jgi:hypothetical protein
MTVQPLLRYGKNQTDPVESSDRGGELAMTFQVEHRFDQTVFDSFQPAEHQIGRIPASAADLIDA